MFKIIFRSNSIFPDIGFSQKSVRLFVSDTNSSKPQQGTLSRIISRIIQFRLIFIKIHYTAKQFVKISLQ